MSEISDKINRISYEVSQGFLMSGNDLTGSIKLASETHGLNPEEIKRVCEKVNQTTYLGLYNDPNIDRANIDFKLASADEITSAIHEEEQAMTDFTMEPADYRVGTDKVAAAPVEASSADIAAAKHEMIQKIANYRDRLSILDRSMETVKVASIREADLSAGKIHDIGRAMVVNGDSYADIMKLASRHVEAHGFSFSKTATIMAHVGEHISGEGIVVNTELTKLSSVPVVNSKHPMNVTALSLASSIEKAAAATDVQLGVKAHIAHLNSVISKLENI